MKDIEKKGIESAVAILVIAAGLAIDALNVYGAINDVVSAHQHSASEATSGALANVRARYKARLSRYGLTESYFDETGGICDLMLLDVNSWTKYQIVYYRSTDYIEWPRRMPKSVAGELMQDRLIIHAYECAIGKKSFANRAQTKCVEARKEQAKYKPLNDEYVPTPEELADEKEASRKSRLALEKSEARRRKGNLNKQSDLRRMAELKRNGMSDDEIASGFGMDRVKEYNKAHPNNPISTSKHSKPGASGAALQNR